MSAKCRIVCKSGDRKRRVRDHKKAKDTSLAEMVRYTDAAELRTKEDDGPKETVV
jgi:hypothetical protein